MIPTSVSTDLHSEDATRRADAIVRIALAMESSQLDEPRGQELSSLVNDLAQTFVRWGNASALWAMGKAPIGLAKTSILELFRDHEPLFDEEALWQADCVVEVGLECEAVPPELFEILRRLCERSAKVGTARTQEIAERLRKSLLRPGHAGVAIGE